MPRPAALRALPLLLLTLAGCLPADEGPAAPDAGVESDAGVPGEAELRFGRGDERLVRVLVNRARADPQADLAGCTRCAEKGCYGVRPPLRAEYRLDRAARFHSAHLRQANRGLSHDSFCTLVQDLDARFVPRGTCDGSASCACVGGSFGCSGAGCTGTFERLRRFGVEGIGENLASGFSSAEAVFYAWLHEPDDTSACGFRAANGHRYNILAAEGPALGVGRVDTFWTQDFGAGGRGGKLVEGAQLGEDFLVNWYDPQGGAPSRARVNVDGTCTELARERGGAGHGTWRGRPATPGTGCRRYVFEFHDAAGALHTLPATGSYTSGCAADWSAERPAACP